MQFTDRQVFWCAGLVCAIMLLKHLLVPLNPDNDTYHAMAWQLYEYGRLPYLGSWDQNFPGVVYLHWLSISFFGNSAVGFRALDAIFHLANALLLFSLTRRWFTPKISALAAILYVLYYTHDSYWLAGQRDGFAVTFILLALYWFFSRGKSKINLTLIGVLLGCATVIRPTYALFGIVIVLLLEGSIASKLRSSLFIAIGGAMIWTVQFIPYLFVDGGIHEYYMATIRFTSDLYGGHALSWSNLLLWNRAQKIYFTILFIGLVVLLVKREALLPRDRQLRVLFLLLFCASLLPVLIMRKFSIYHYDPLFALLTPVCAFFLVRTSELFGKYSTATLFLLLGLAAFRLYPRHVVREYVFAKNAAGDSRLDYVYNRIDHDTLYGNGAQAELARYIRLQTQPSDAIEYATIWPGASWRSERLQASRFTTWYALAMTGKEGEHTPYQVEWQKEYVDSIDRVRPKLVIVAQGPKSFLLKPEQEPINKFIALDGMQGLMNSMYTFDTTFRGFTIYRLKE